jgi:uncharacterized membrane protein
VSEREIGRVGAFSDGVFAVAITLLVLDIHRPDDFSQLPHALLDLWPSYLAYVTSFVSIGSFWMHHHYVFGLLARVDWVFMGLNTLILMFIAFMPFPTAVLAESLASGEGRVAATVFYAVVLCLTSVLTNVAWQYAARGRRLIEPHVPAEEVRMTSQTYRIGPVGYLIAAGVAFFSTLAAIAICGTLVLLYVLPTSHWLAERETAPREEN